MDNYSEDREYLMLPSDEPEAQQTMLKILKARRRYEERKASRPIDIYIACPYSHPEPEIQKERFEDVTEYAAQLTGLFTDRPLVVYSPITHSHAMQAIGGLEGGWNHWHHIDETFLKLCKEMHVLQLEGWEKSTGVKAEIKIAEENGIPVRYIDPDASYASHLVIAESSGKSFRKLQTGTAIRHQMERLGLSFHATAARLRVDPSLIQAILLGDFGQFSEEQLVCYLKQLSIEEVE